MKAKQQTSVPGTVPHLGGADTKVAGSTSYVNMISMHNIQTYVLCTRYTPIPIYIYYNISHIYIYVMIYKDNIYIYTVQYIYIHYQHIPKARGHACFTLIQKGQGSAQEFVGLQCGRPPSGKHRCFEQSSEALLVADDTGLLVNNG